MTSTTADGAFSYSTITTIRAIGLIAAFHEKGFWVYELRGFSFVPVFCNEKKVRFLPGKAAEDT